MVDKNRSTSTLLRQLNYSHGYSSNAEKFIAQRGLIMATTSPIVLLRYSWGNRGVQC